MGSFVCLFVLILGQSLQQEEVKKKKHSPEFFFKTLCFASIIINLL